MLNISSWTSISFPMWIIICTGLTRLLSKFQLLKYYKISKNLKFIGISNLLVNLTFIYLKIFHEMRTIGTLKLFAGLFQVFLIGSLFKTGIILECWQPDVQVASDFASFDNAIQQSGIIYCNSNSVSSFLSGHRSI